MFQVFKFEWKEVLNLTSTNQDTNTHNTQINANREEILDEGMSDIDWKRKGIETWEKLQQEGVRFNKNEFIDWWMERKKLGIVLDHRLVARAYLICKDINTELDHFTVIDGDEGSGKSTLAMQLASWVDPDFSLKDLIYDPNEYKNLIRMRINTLIFSGGGGFKYNFNVLKPKNIIIDEGVLLLYKRKAMTQENIKLNQLFAVQRACKLHIIFCIPRFWDLDQYVREHRVNTLIHVWTRGKATLFVKDGIRDLNKQIKKLGYYKIKHIKGEYKYDFNFTGEFPYTIDYNKYLYRKLESIKELT